MTPMKKAVSWTTEKAEKHRRPIGFSSLAFGLVMCVTLIVIATTVIDSNNIVHVNHETLHSRLTDWDRLVAAIDSRSDYDIVLHWSDESQELLGWTREDIDSHGLDAVVTEGRGLFDIDCLQEVCEGPVKSSSVIDTLAMHKNGDVVKVRVVFWVEDVDGIKTINTRFKARPS